MSGLRPLRLAPLALLSAVLAAGPATAQAAPEVTRAERMTRGDDIPTRTYSSPALAVDPENEDNVFAVYAEMRTARCGVARSADGGRTWKRLAASPALPSYPLCFTPTSSNVHHAQVAFGRNHVLYVALAGWDVQDGLRTSVLLARSEDLGETWSTTLVRDVRSKPESEAEITRPISSLAVDRRGPQDVLYIGFTQRFPNARPPRPGVPAVAVSVDGGRTFSEPVDVIGGYFADEANLRDQLRHRVASGPPNAPVTPPEAVTGAMFGGQNPQLLLGRNGELYAAWTAHTIGLTPHVPNSLFVSRSTDEGRTWTVLSRPVIPGGAFGNAAVAWTPAGGPNGTIHLAYENRVPLVQGDRDIFHQRSTDGGRTWTEPRILNDEDPKLLVAQFLPNIVATPDGRVDVAWWDFRNDTGAFLNDTYLATSPDNGQTWSKNVRVTDRSIDRKIGPWSNGYDVRQPPGLAATAPYTVVAWDDTRDGDLDGQAQDLYRALVQFEALPADRSPALVYLFAGVLGLVLAGLIVTVIGLANRRRTRPPPFSSDTPSTEPVGVT